jgi:hypothetical protein
MLTSRSLRIPLCLSVGALLLAAAWGFQAPSRPAGTQPAAGGAPQPSPEMLSAQKASEQDRQLMLDLLRITSLRPPVDARAKTGPHIANYDQSTADPYPKLPAVLTLKNGKKVTTARMWWDQRRPEIVEDFDREVYGRMPKVTPKVTWQVAGTKEETVSGVPVITKQLVGHTDNSAYPQITVDIQLTLSTPSRAAGPVPVIMVFGAPTVARPPTQTAGAGAPMQGYTGPSWQELTLAKGWGLAYLNSNSIQADNGAGLTKGIIGLVNKGQPRKPDDWGQLRALGWGVSRAMDYFETDKAVDAKRVAIHGHSRGGKAAVVAMAYDQRVATGFISSSGEGGVKLHRRNYGEIVDNLAAANEYHWMAGNFLKYAGPLTWNDLPVDAHELLAMCAPRPVFIGAGNLVDPAYDIGNSDAWADAKGMFMAAVAANPVYKLLGKQGLVGATAFPPIETTLIEGELGFRQHTYGHTPAPNWPAFLEFAERHFKAIR